MLVSATIRRTLPAAAELPDSPLDVRLSHPESSRPTSAVALKPAPAAFLDVTAEGLAEELALGAAFLFGDSLRLAGEVRGERERENSCGPHFWASLLV
jgi:hypothetical protein